MDLSPVEPASRQSEQLQVFEPLCAVFRRKLKAEGLKYTPERAQILDAIIQAEGVFQADELLERLRGQDFRVSKATVYRTIKLLLESGIIQQVLFDSEQAHYQLAWGQAAAGVIVRTDTGETIQVEAPELVLLRDRLCARHGLVPQGHRLVIYAAAPPAAGT